MTEEQIETKLAEMEIDSEKCVALKSQLQFRQKVISMCPSDDKKLFYLSGKSQVKVCERVNGKFENTFEAIKK